LGLLFLGSRDTGDCPSFLPYFIAPLCEVVQVLVVLQVDHIPNVSGHLQEKQGFYDVIQVIQFLGDEMVHQD
jgi:hypothetical protein